MGGMAKSRLTSRGSAATISALGDPVWVKCLVGTASVAFLGLFLVVPLAHPTRSACGGCRPREPGVSGGVNNADASRNVRTSR